MRYERGMRYDVREKDAVCGTREGFGMQYADAVETCCWTQTPRHARTHTGTPKHGHNALRRWGSGHSNAPTQIHRHMGTPKHGQEGNEELEFPTFTARIRTFVKSPTQDQRWMKTEEVHEDKRRTI